MYHRFFCYDCQFIILIEIKKMFYSIFCAIVLYLVVYHICFQDGKLCLLVANDKLDGK
jgi:hypothetical protein